MTEHLGHQQPVPPQASVVDADLEVNLGIEQFVQDGMHRLQEAYPDLEALQRPEVTESAHELAQEFAIKPSFFEGADASARMLIFASYADRYARMKNSQGMPQAVAEKTFIANGIFALAKDHTDAFDELKSQLESDKEHNRSDGHSAQVIDKYTQPELTVAMQKAFEDGVLMGTVKEQMGITPENEDPYEIHVLSITTNSDTYGIGRSFPEEGWPSAEDWRKDPDAARIAERDNDYEYKAFDEWKAGLDRNMESFLVDYGANSVPGGFVTNSDGRTLLVLAAPLGEKIVYDDDDENRHSYYDEGDLERDKAIARHEYVHTQGGLNTEGVFFGINFEERRAEYFSGDKQGYQDIKMFCADLKLATGFDVTDYFSKHVKGGDKSDFYAELARYVGLDLLPDVLTAVPKAYFDEQNGKIQREIIEHTGSYAGVIDRLMDRVGDNPDAQAAADQRIEESAQKFADSTLNNFEFVRDYRKRLGSVRFTDTVFDRAEEIRRNREPTVGAGAQ